MQHQLPTAKIVDQYKLTSANDVPERNPQNWQLQGSNNGTSWTTLDTRTAQIFDGRFVTNTYKFNNSTAYTSYRLNITANVGGSGHAIQLSELSLFSAQGTSKHQRWTISGVPGSTFGTTMSVNNVNSGKALSVFGNSTASGANIIQTTPDTSSGGLGQRWLFQLP